MTEILSYNYETKYFEWQKPYGVFGGWADKSKFDKYISKTDTVLDFGCGRGFLLKGLECYRKLGIEVNPSAAEYANKINGLDIFYNALALQDESIDVIISNHALEHTLHPLYELRCLYKKLKFGGKIIFAVPCESISRRYKQNDINNHLYSWSPMCIGNLFKEAGFSVIESKPYAYKWPPMYDALAQMVGKRAFEFICRIYGQVSRSCAQVRIVAIKDDRH